MNKTFYVRFDDICPTMDFEQFEKAKKLMDKYGIKPLIGVIPDNQDPDQMKNPELPNFWEYIKKLQSEGWVVALHGYHHVYNQPAPRTMISGRKHSEFAGNSYAEQYEMIRKGKQILESHGIFTDIFFAPAHTYDKNTLKALAANGFRYNIDGLSRKPYRQCGVINIPCRSFGGPKKCGNKINIAVNHSSEWTRPDKADGFNQLERFCELNADKISDFKNVKNERIGNFFIQKIIEKVWRFNKNIRSFVRKIIKP